jgi:hypothetical protein
MIARGNGSGENSNGVDDDDRNFLRRLEHQLKGCKHRYIDNRAQIPNSKIDLVK